MTIYTNTQVQEQKERFESFMATANLRKIGERYMHFSFHNAGNGLYNQYNYIRRVLRLVANVHHAMYHPDHLAANHNHFYGNILEVKALDAFLTSLPKK